MATQPARIEDTRVWLTIALRDFERARLLRGQATPDIEGALFNAQQATEKALKGLLAWHDTPFLKTHDLTELADLCLATDASLRGDVAGAARLTAFAWRFRYPGGGPVPSLAETEECLSLAERAVNAVLARVPAEARPVPGGR